MSSSVPSYKYYMHTFFGTKISIVDFCLQVQEAYGLREDGEQECHGQHGLQAVHDGPLLQGHR